MHLNQIQPAEGSKKNRLRVGRGFTRGKTCGRGRKGQHSRSGGFHRIGFEGGQTPLARRVPKSGFNSRMARTTYSIPLSLLNKVVELEDKEYVVDLMFLQALGLVPGWVKRVRVYFSGEISKAVKVRGIHFTKGAAEALKKAGGELV